MEHYDETISKFLEALNVDSIKDVRYQGKIFTYQRCICGQRIQTCYVFRNQKTRNNASLVKNASNILLTISVGNKNISI